MSACSTGHHKQESNLRLLHRGQDPKTFNPWIASDASSSEMAALMFEGLVYFDPNTDQPVPNLAKDFIVSPDGKTIRIILRNDIFWSDGQAINAEDVEYTWNSLIRDEIAISSLKDVLLVNGKFPVITIINDHTIEFKVAEVFAPFLRTLNIEIAPKHHIERFLAEQHAQTLEDKQKAFNNYLNIHVNPKDIVSSGAFRLRKLTSGERIEFVKNKKYFKKDDKGNPLPYLDRLTFAYAADDSAAVFKFLAKEVHALSVSPQNAAFIKSLEKQYNFTLYDLGPSSGTSFIWFNLSRNIPEPQYSWFNNRYFRQAVSYAIDRDSIVNNVFQGLGAPLFTAESLQSPYLNESLAKGYKHDTTQAKQLLVEAGFKLQQRNGQLELIDQNNNKVEFDLFTNAGNTERELMSVMIINNLKKIGIKVNFKALEFNNFVGRIMQGKDYQAGIIGLTASNEPNNGSNVWKSGGRMHMFDIKEFQTVPLTRDWELKINQLLIQGTSVLDFNKRKVIYDKFQEIVYEENPFIYLASPKNLIAVNNKVKGLQVTKYHGIMPFMERIYLEK